MDASDASAQSEHASRFQTPLTRPVVSPRPATLLVRRLRNFPARSCLVILIGWPQRIVARVTAANARVRCLHAYGAHGASALCGACDWHELVPPNEATCPACRGRLERGTMLPPGIH